MCHCRGWFLVLMCGLLSPAWANAQDHGPRLPHPELIPPGPPRLVAPLPPPQPRVPLHHHRYGSFVRERVPLYPRVRVKDRDDVAPGAVLMIIAIKDPNICRKRCRCCTPRCVYVKIYVPPCPPWKIDVNRYGTDIELDYGEYEIEVESKRGVVTIEYDD